MPAKPPPSMSSRKASQLRLAAMTAIVLGALTTAHPASTQTECVPTPNGTSRPVDPAPIEAAIQKLAADVQRWGGILGVHIVDVTTGATIAAVNEHRPFNPASNAKLATAAAALHLLGAQHRFLTGLYGKIEGDTVDEIVMRGDGDPSLRTADLWAMATELRASGVRRVRIIAMDQSFFDDRYVPPAFDQQPNEWAPFRAPVAAVSLNENTVVFSIRPMKEGASALVDADPPGFVEFTSSVTSGLKDEPARVVIGLEPKGTRLVGRVSGTVPRGRLLRVAKRVDDPRTFAGYGLQAVLQQVGIEALGDVRLGGTSYQNLLVAHRSASLGELLSGLGKESDNFYAEMLFKALGAKAGGKAASAEAGARATLTALQALGALDQGVEIANGSGLFDADRSTPAAITALLRAMQRDPVAGPEYLAHLSVGGVDGTLRHRFRSWSSQRAVRAKTGTLKAVAALSGYILPPAGKGPLVFSILLNGITGRTEAARSGMDAVVEAAVRELWNGPAR